MRTRPPRWPLRRGRRRSRRRRFRHRRPAVGFTRRCVAGGNICGDGSRWLPRRPRAAAAATCRIGRRCHRRRPCRCHRRRRSRRWQRRYPPPPRPPPRRHCRAAPHRREANPPTPPPGRGDGDDAHRRRLLAVGALTTVVTAAAAAVVAAASPTPPPPTPLVLSLAVPPPRLLPRSPAGWRCRGVAGDGAGDATPSHPTKPPPSSLPPTATFRAAAFAQPPRGCHRQALPPPKCRHRRSAPPPQRSVWMVFKMRLAPHRDKTHKTRHTATTNRVTPRPWPLRCAALTTATTTNVWQGRLPCWGGGVGTTMAATAMASGGGRRARWWRLTYRLLRVIVIGRAYLDHIQTLRTNPDLLLKVPRARSCARRGSRVRPTTISENPPLSASCPSGGTRGRRRPRSPAGVHRRPRRVSEGRPANLPPESHPYVGVCPRIWMVVRPVSSTDFDASPTIVPS